MSKEFKANIDDEKKVVIHTKEKEFEVKTISDLLTVFSSLYADKKQAETEEQEAEVEKAIKLLKENTKSISASWGDVEDALEDVIYELMYQQKEKYDKLNNKIDILFRALKYSRSISNKSIKSVEEQFEAIDNEKENKKEEK